ncbi:MAG: Tetratricopeptide 2 repeat protein, partial [Myxococcales bacterium]|nr:Tetratricopeptide 2 repeat protein [Myxococcales bacterium]
MSVGAAVVARARRAGASGLAVFFGLVVVAADGGGQARGAEGPAVDSFARELEAAVASLDARRGRPEAVAPLAKLAWLDENVPTGATDAALRRAAGPGSHPLVAAQATMLLAHQLEERGDDAGARALRAPLHALTKLWVVGPFGEGRGGFSQEFPPETDPELPSRAHSYKGKLGVVSWRAAEGAVREGALLVDALVRPDSQTTAYVSAFVNSPREQVVAVRLGSPGPTKLWVGGSLVYARDVVRTPSFDQDAAAARLRKGWNRLLVKTVITEGAWWLHLRVTDAAGHALDLGDGALPDGAVVVAPKGKAKPAGGVETLEGDLRRRAEAAPAGAGGAEAWLDLGRALAWNGSGDRDAREAATAVETALGRQPSIAAYRLLSAVARDDDERRRAFEAALALTEAPGE